MTNINNDITELSKFARAVVAKRVAIVAAVTIVVQLAISYHWITPDVSDNVLHWLNAALDAVAGLVAIAVLHPVVTPVKDPQNNNGEKLLPVSAVKVLADDIQRDTDWANAVANADEAGIHDPLADVDMPDDALADVSAEDVTPPTA